MAQKYYSVTNPITTKEAVVAADSSTSAAAAEYRIDYTKIRDKKEALYALKQIELRLIEAPFPE